MAAFLAELEKCVLLCANCHGEVEAGIVQSPAAGAGYGEGPPVLMVRDEPPSAA
jgi:hypothetical protein